MKWVATLNEAVRPTCAILAMVGVTVGFFMKMIEAQAYLSTVSLILGFFFMKREIDKDRQ